MRRIHRLNIHLQGVKKAHHSAPGVFLGSAFRFPIYCQSRSFSEEDNEPLVDIEASTPKAGDLDLHAKSGKRPSEIVAELGRFIVGQEQAKKAVAIALRNRWRRHKLDEKIREEVMPKNILMIGPTGCGKTEVARRLAKLTDAPFLKVEATKFTEVGFHGRDVDTMIRDLVMQSIHMLKKKKRRKLQEKIKQSVEKRLLELLVGGKDNKDAQRDHQEFLRHLREGNMDEVLVSIEVPGKAEDVPGMPPALAMNLQKLFSGKAPPEKKEMKVKDARVVLEEVELERLVNNEDINREAIRYAEQDGIIFLDEIDKICSPSNSLSRHADASAEGVQRDLLPLIEGTRVPTKFGPVNTDHILFIASGAFHSVKPSDLLAELQGRLPIRVELKALTEDDLHRILTETENNLIYQQIALMKIDNVELKFTPEAIREIAHVAAEVNRMVENIGARRLHTIIERIIEDISYEAPDMAPGTVVTIDKSDVLAKTKELMQKHDLTKFIL